MWFGTLGKKCIYALPGNPVSILVCLRRYVLPALVINVRPSSVQHLALADTFKPKGKLTLFAAVSLTSSPEYGTQAQRISHHGSGYASLIHSDGFVELESRDHLCKKGPRSSLTTHGR